MPGESANLNVALYKTLLTMPENQELRLRTSDSQPCDQLILPGGLGDHYYFQTWNFPLLQKKRNVERVMGKEGG